MCLFLLLIKTQEINFAVCWESGVVLLLLSSLAKVNFTLAPASETTLSLSFASLVFVADWSYSRSSEKGVVPCYKRLSHSVEAWVHPEKGLNGRIETLLEFGSVESQWWKQSTVGMYSQGLRLLRWADGVCTSCRFFGVGKFVPKYI